MKHRLVILAVLVTFKLTAQTVTLPSGVYNIHKLAGGTTDLEKLKIHTSTLKPGQINHPPCALNDTEELIFVQNGKLSVIINDTAKTIGPGSIMLIVAGDSQSFRNTSDSAVTYCVISFQAKLPVNTIRAKQSGGSLIKDWNDLTEKKTSKGWSRSVFDRPTSMFSRLEVHVTALNAGFESHAPHVHRAEELMLLIKGNVTANIADHQEPAALGNAILIAPNILHNVKNTGNDQCWYYAVKWFN